MGPYYTSDPNGFNPFAGQPPEMMGGQAMYPSAARTQMVPNPYWSGTGLFGSNGIMPQFIPADLLPFLHMTMRGVRNQINGKRVINPRPAPPMPAPILGVRG